MDEIYLCNLLGKTFGGVGFLGTGKLTHNSGSILFHNESNCWPTVVYFDYLDHKEKELEFHEIAIISLQIDVV